MILLRANGLDRTRSPDGLGSRRAADHGRGQAAGHDPSAGTGAGMRHQALIVATDSHVQPHLLSRSPRPRARSERGAACLWKSCSPPSSRRAADQRLAAAAGRAAERSARPEARVDSVHPAGPRRDRAVPERCRAASGRLAGRHAGPGRPGRLEHPARRPRHRPGNRRDSGRPRPGGAGRHRRATQAIPQGHELDRHTTQAPRDTAAPAPRPAAGAGRAPPQGPTRSRASVRRRCRWARSGSSMAISARARSTRCS